MRSESPSLSSRRSSELMSFGREMRGTRLERSAGMTTLERQVDGSTQAANPRLTFLAPMRCGT